MGTVWYLIVKNEEESWHFTQIWKALAWPHHLTKNGGLVHRTSFTSPLFIEVPAPRHAGVR